MDSDGVSLGIREGVYILLNSDMDRPRGFTEIYALEINSGSQIRLTDSLSNKYGQVWSPDGGEILFFSPRFRENGGDFTNIWKIAPDGTELTRITNEPANHYNMEWSPNGEQIVYEENDRDGYHWSEVFVMNSDGSQVRNVTNNPANDFRPSWSVDGNWILFYSNRTGERERFSVGLDGLGVFPLAESAVKIDLAPLGARDGVCSTSRNNP